MEALERSAQLTDSVERLAKIPGFRAMASKLSERSEKVLQEQEIKVSKGLDINSENEEHKASGPIQ